MATLRRGHFDATYGDLANDVYSGRLTAHITPRRRTLIFLGEWTGLKGSSCKTQLPLHSIAPVVYGYHENPFEVSVRTRSSRTDAGLLPYVLTCRKLSERGSSTLLTE